jgi:hypothetical protein
MSWVGNNNSGHTLNGQLLAEAEALDGREEDDYLMVRDRRLRHDLNGSGEVNANGSVVSNGDDSYPSMAESIMSDLSENLIALDLAEPRLLDQI